MPSNLKFNRELVVRIFFFTTFAFLLYQLFLLSRPFMTALLGAALLAIGFYPLNAGLRKRIKSHTLSAMAMTLAVLLIIFVPLSIVLWLVLRESKGLLPTVQNIIESFQTGDVSSLKSYVPPFVTAAIERAAGSLDGGGFDLKATILDWVQSIGARITGWSALFARNVLLFLFNGLILVISLFFAFRDGDKWLRWILSLVPMDDRHKAEIARRAYETFRAVTIGVFVTATAQGITAMIGFFISGTRLPVLLGIATTILSFFGASFIVTLPVALFTLRTDTFWGVFLLIWGAFVVGFLDNLLKPILIGSRARMPFILVFFSIMGGLKMYGLLGLVLGPLLVACVLTFIKIYQEAYNA